MTDRAPETVVFLGPSLARDAAAAILDATYVPPVQFGDVYRWIGSGVRSLVVIDGVFHGRAPVWQRELLTALRAGIRVYGAASMGALRAAELRAYGMVGLGTVYEWYVDGEIDGDDEVALLHASAEQHYRALSEPLVNLRATLRAAVASGVIDAACATALVADVKRLPFWTRSSEAMWSAPALTALGPMDRARLRAWVAEHAIDVKRRDATLALTEIARRAPEQQAAPPRPLPASASHYERYRLLKRAFSPPAGGPPLDGEQLVELLLADPARRKLLRWSLSARFFVTRWALDAQVPAPHAMDRPLDWLRANALSASEHAALAPRLGLVAWLLAQSPEVSGLDSILQDEALLPELPDLEELRSVCSRQTLARMLPWVAAWCDRVGAAPSPAETATWTARWSDALARLASQGRSTECPRFLAAMWAIDHGPVYFGFATWSFAAELLTLLQWTGAVPALMALEASER